MPIPEDWRAFIESLNSHGVELGREELILNKRMTGRTKDKLDLEALSASEEE
jgi:hypothetical protein